MKKLILGLIIFNLFFVSGLNETPHTPEIITITDQAIIPVSFFNNGNQGIYTASFEKESSIVRLESSTTVANHKEFGYFKLIIGENNPEKGIYFNNLLIYNKGILVQKIPIIIGIESKRQEYDSIIEFDQSSDVSVNSSNNELMISPKITVYKLDYNYANYNDVSFKFLVYDLSGNLIYSSEKPLSISRQSSFEQFANLGTIYPSEVILYAECSSNLAGAEKPSIGIDLYQISLPNDLLLSPPLEEKDYSFEIYMGIFFILLCSIILISYLWYNKYVEQARDWRSKVNEIKNFNFNDSAKALRKLKNQRSILDRAYANHYISKRSYDSAISEISRLASKLKKRL